MIEYNIPQQLSGSAPMDIFRPFRKPKKESTPVICDVCKKPVHLTASLIPPGVVLDYSKGKAYSICGFCQYRLELKATEAGFLIHGIKDGHGYVDLDRIERLIKEEEAYASKNQRDESSKPTTLE